MIEKPIDEWRVKASAVEPIRAKQDVERLRMHFRSNYAHGALYALVVTLGCNFGLRAGDLLKLRAGDVRGTHLNITEQKTKKPRRIFINGRARVAIDAHMKQFIFIADTAKLFTSQKGQITSVKTLHRLIKNGCREIGLEGNFGSHTLRKTCAYHAYQYTRDIESIKRMMNHSDTRVTRVYVGDELELDDDEPDFADDEIYSALNL